MTESRERLLCLAPATGVGRHGACVESGYRADIQILRGLAVLAVVAFHLRPDIVASGFLGVDIFFVLSGFLMASLYDPSTAREVGNFLLRRARRILPAYFAVMAVVIVISAILVLPHEYRTFVDHALFSIALMPNIGFWLDSSYFQESQFRPLLHFWSLGVEIQFYLVFPIIVWLYRQYRWLVLLASLANLALCLAMLDVSAYTAFYLTPFRIWQFMAGFFVAKWLRARPELFRAAHWQWLATLACVGMAALCFMPIDEADHPGLVALVVTVLVSCILWMGLPIRIVASTFGRAVEKVGVYSYSIYLVHFPVIIIWMHLPFKGNIVDHMTIADILVIVGLTGVLSFGLFHLVETPFRKPILARRFVTLQSAMAAGVLLIVLLSPPLQRQMFAPQQLRILDSWFDRGTYRCGPWLSMLSPLERSCELVEARDGSPSFLIVGDSHADSLKPALIEEARRRGIGLRLIKENCALGSGESCKLDAVVDEAVKTGVTKLIVHSFAGAIDVGSIEAAVGALAPYGVDVAFIDPVPTWSFHVPEALYAVATGAADALPSQNLADYQEKSSRALGSLATISSASFERYEIGQIFCASECRKADPEGRPLYYDSSHVTVTGATLLAPVVQGVFRIRAE